MTKICILDIETDSLDITKANIKFVGCLEETGKTFIFNYTLDGVKKNIINYLKQFDKIITFNGENYDVPILQRHGIEIPYWKHIDLYKVFKKRAVLLRSGGFKSYSLNNILLEIGEPEKKGDIDYNIFLKPNWTEIEIEEIHSYLKQDLVLTKKLWDFLINKFDSFKLFISHKDGLNFKHITSSSGAYAYKVICHMLNITEEYADIEGNDDYQGAYVMTPKKEFVKGKIVYLDFASLYPMLYVHSNLFSYNCKCCTQEEKWHGNDIFNVEGYYCSKKQGRIEEVIKNLFLKRKEYKKNKDNREFALKITLNSLYGISAKPSFKNLYNPYTAKDCTSLARQCIDYAIKKYEDKGYIVVYADTDSCFIELNENQTTEECVTLAQQISKEISNSFPFPWNEFDLKLEDELKYLHFSRNKQGQFNKKNYIFLTKDNELTIKGLDIIKRNCSKLSTYIFNAFLKKQLIDRVDCKFKKYYIDNLIQETILKDKLIMAKRFNIKEVSAYKSTSSIYYLINQMYGPGEVFLIKNKIQGVGKKVKYCSLKEAETLKIEELDLADIYKELAFFIKDYFILTAKPKKKSLKNCNEPLNKIKPLKKEEKREDK